MNSNFAILKIKTWFQVEKKNIWAYTSAKKQKKTKENKQTNKQTKQTKKKQKKKTK